MNPGISARRNGNAVPPGASILAVSGDTIEVFRRDSSRTSWFLLTPVRKFYDNTESPGHVTELEYAVTHLEDSRWILSVLAGETPPFPELGTFYIASGLPDSLNTEQLTLRDPPNLVFPERVFQVSVRPGDTYTDYLFELINVPFIMAPFMTPAGVHQTDSRLGCDCAAFAVYGKRRQGFDFEYLGPEGIRRYLTPISENPLHPVEMDSVHVYLTSDGRTFQTGSNGLSRGDILHFRAQVSVFYCDEGIPGVLDSHDLVIQSWFDGPHICRIEENGFFPLPLLPMRWKE
ncbi:MAG: hypothetical protein GF388_02625 [Candidatus Aegiribacteria sp.]|nr:hypothetical protein [Candidatus Aegiribacteria sp.]